MNAYEKLAKSYLERQSQYPCTEGNIEALAVSLELHAEPVIVDWDSLSDEDRWQTSDHFSDLAEEAGIA